MRYFSTRDKKLNFSFTEIFSRGLAPDGGLFIPSELKKYSSSELKSLQNLSLTAVLEKTPYFSDIRNPDKVLEDFSQTIGLPKNDTK